MKIKKIEIYNPKDIKLREIDFNESGLSLIYGNISKPDETKESSNSLGKTLLLKMVDLVFGKSNSKKGFHQDINNYIIKATLRVSDHQYINIKRVINVPDENYIEDKKYNSTQYKNAIESYGNERKYSDKQTFLEPKNHLISKNRYPNTNDYIYFLYLTNLIAIEEVVSDIYLLKDRLNNAKNTLKYKYGTKSLRKEIEEDYYFINNEVSNLNSELEEIKGSIKNIETTELKDSLISKFNTLNSEYKFNSNSISKNALEITRIKDYLDSYSSNDITSEEVLNLYKEANIEIPTMVKKRLKEVEEFNQKVITDRVYNLRIQISKLESQNHKLIKKNKQFKKDIDRMGKIISENEVYQEQIALFDEYSSKYSELKFEQGKLSDILSIEEDKKQFKSEMTVKMLELQQAIKNSKALILKYREFINATVSIIYEEKNDAYFTIESNEKFNVNNPGAPLSIELNFRGDAGEGMNNVRYLLIDYLVFSFNEEIDYIILDSSCFNGIDPRQKMTLIKILDDLANEHNKQAILSMSKYELPDYQGTYDLIKENIVIQLDEDNKLLKKDF